MPWQGNPFLPFNGRAVAGTLVCSDGLGNRAVFNTRAASGAQIHVNAPGPLFDLDFEISGFAFNGFQIRICD
jgi:hypothetical protein